MKILSAILICIVLCGCATAGSFTDRHIDIGMTKERIVQAIGFPFNCSRHVINGHTYETWSYPGYSTCDFVDGTLTGYQSDYAHYHSTTGTEDVRNSASH
jgi:hypothetical protein